MNIVQSIFTEIGVICLWSCQNWIRTAPGFWSDSRHSRQDLRSTSSWRILGKGIQEKNGVSEMITSAPRMIDKMRLKSSRESLILREKRICRPCSPSCILHCPEAHWSLPSETIPVGFCLIWRSVGQTLIYWFETRPHGFQQKTF